MSFLESPRFPTDISYGSSGGPSYNTQVVKITSGYEARNQNWLNSRYSFDVGYGIRSIAMLNALVSFFHECRGMLHAFRYKDWADYTDDGDGIVVDVGGTLYLAKRYGSTNSYDRIINKPVSGSVVLSGSGSVDATTGICTGGTIAGDTWTGQFDVPVRFDTDEINLVYSNYEAGSISVPLIEVRL